MVHKSDVLFLFYGYGCEYSLAPLAKYMRDLDYNVMELDLLYINDIGDKLSNIKGRKVVFITSWHLFFDKTNFDLFIRTDKSVDVLSPLEVMNYLRPLKSIYYPHDLTDFLHEQEWSWLDLFDAVMVPYKNNDYYLMKRYTNVFDVGWIKKINSTKKVQNKREHLRIVHFPSHSAYIKSFSPAQYYEQWKPLFSTGVEVKFPLIGGLDEYKKILDDNKIKIIDSNKTVFDIIDECDIIIATGSSSVLYEAGLSGRPVISVLDGALSVEQYNEILPNYEWLYKLEINEATELINEVKQGNKVLRSGEDMLKPMDFAFAESLLSNVVNG